MLRINTIHNTEQAIKYYAKHLASDDYYAKDQVLIPEWEGNLAKELGLSGSVTMQDYINLMNNINPETGETLTQVNFKNRRAGYDFTFSVPKSMSVEYALNDNQEMLEIFNLAVKKTMLEIEKEALTRVRNDNQDYDRLTGNIIYANYVHRYARPDKDGIPDPHLHAHIIVANATRDPETGQIKALQIGDLKKDGNYFQQIFNNYLTEELTNKGYEINKIGWNFELAGYGEPVLDKFSNRTKLIESKIKELGITYAEDAGSLGAKTRNSKNSKLTNEFLQKTYFDRLSEKELEFVKSSKNQFTKITPDEKMLVAKNSMNFVVDKNYERNSVVSYKRLLTEAMKDSLEKGVNIKWLQDEFSALKTRGELLEKEGSKFSLQSTKNFTTKKVKNEELELTKNIADFEKVALLNENFQILPKQDFELSLEQKESVNSILKSDSRIMIFTGKAGTGKTTTLQEIQTGIKEAGLSNYIFAPTTGAVDTLKKDGFNQALTIQAFLSSPDIQKKTTNQVIMIDESGLISVPQANQIVKIAKENNARIIFVGDSAQHSSVERGDALRLIETQENTTKTNIYSIRRQRGEYRDATQKIAKGEILSGYNKLDSLGYVKQDATLSRLYKKASSSYVQSIMRGETVGLYTPTHTEGKSLIAPIRESLKNNGKITGSETKHEILQDLNWENALKSRTDDYKNGMYLYFNQNAGEFKKDDIVEVIVDGRKDKLEKVTIKTINNQIMPLPTSESEKFSVIKKEEINLAVGDKLVTTNSIKYLDDQGVSKKIPNGKKLKVKSISDNGDLIVKEDKREDPRKGIKAEVYFLPKNEARINYGYYSTSHKGQGDTVDKAIIVATTKSLPAINDKQFYVSSTRGRDTVTIYTDNKVQFEKHIQKEGLRELATEKPRTPTKAIQPAKAQTKSIAPTQNKPIVMTR